MYREHIAAIKYGIVLVHFLSMVAKIGQRDQSIYISKNTLEKIPYQPNKNFVKGRARIQAQHVKICVDYQQ